MILGYNQANAMRRSTLEDDVRLCAEAGFGAIEMRLDMLWAYLRQHTLEELGALFAQSPLTPYALNAMESHIAFYTAAEKTKDHPALEELKRACKVARRLGIRDIIALPPMGRSAYSEPYGMQWEEVLEHCAPALHVMAEVAGEYGVCVCLEPVGAPKSAIRTVQQASCVLQAAACANTGLVVDAANLYMYHKLADFSAVAALRAEDIHVVHINDFDDVPEEAFDRRYRCFCGRGVIDLAAFLAAVQQTGYDGVVSVETLRPEYWEQEPAKVIQDAYDTTLACLQANGCG